MHTGCPGHLAEQMPQGVFTAQLVVAVGQDDQGGQAFHPPDQEAQGVQGGLVGPVDILDDEYRST